MFAVILNRMCGHRVKLQSHSECDHVQGFVNKAEQWKLRCFAEHSS